MKKQNIFKIILCFALIMGIAFALKSLTKNTYTIRMEVPPTSKGEEVEASGRQLAYFKINTDKMNPWDLMRLSKDANEMSLADLEEKLGQKAKLSQKSQLYKDDKKINTSKSENLPDLKDYILIDGLDEGTYLICESDESLKNSKSKKKLQASVEYVGEESTKNKVLNLIAN